MKKTPLKLGQTKPQKPSPKPKPAPVTILDDAAIDVAPLKELRTAYRELRTLHQTRLEELIGERVKDVLKRLRREGKKTGGHRPLGFIVAKDRKLEPDKHERKIALIAKEQHSQDMSLRKIAAYLEGEGFVARNGKRFEANQVKRLIERADTFAAKADE